MRKFPFLLLTVLCSSFSIGFLGCDVKDSVQKTGTTSSAHGGGHQHATTLAGALKEIEEFRGTIKEAFAKKSPDDAHDALHEIGHVLESVTELAAPANDEAKKSVKTAVDELFDCFGAMDDTLHNKNTGKTYEEVADRIDAAMSTLNAMVKP
jgi:hypothetical protein